MAENHSKIVEVPSEVIVEVQGSVLKANGEKGAIERELVYPGVSFRKKDSSVIFESKNDRKEFKAIIGTYASHLRNMIKGVSEGYEYTLNIVYTHFPITLKEENGVVEVHNFYGEKVPRKAKILDGVEVELQKEKVIVSGIDKENVGQTASNIQNATKLRGRDTRIFQDGIYVVSKK
ncbi:MAG: 50S ribosomal protein L6 [archaeon]|jgi:large subunit ribosomal protein L6|nr:50S ribosomal protein L6 [Euryarchaeota archaeon]MDP6704493.1 50S ribosomal protein L6 [archaeon]MDP7260770.1 50S ribosomal protein L6 [archaeon]|tara:strand:+ start:30645 stop:31175 length:531 start_codon:yes stop_codon:yes gene_type:complete